LDFFNLPHPVATDEFERRQGGLAWWLGLGVQVAVFAASVIITRFVLLALSPKAGPAFRTMLIELGVVSVVGTLLMLVPVTLDWLSLQRVRRTLHSPSNEQDVAKLEAALRRRWMAPNRVILLGLLATMRTGHGQLPKAIALYGAALKELDRGGPRKIQELIALSLLSAFAYAGRCEEAEQWASEFERQVPKRACQTTLARAVVACHRGDFERVLALTLPISASAGPPGARALKAYALTRCGEDTQGRELASTLPPARRAAFADVCFASADLKRFLMECGVDASATDPI
jgi:hypothetical protein